MTALRTLRLGAGRAHWQVALLLAFQVALYLWMAPRGFEFTDEAFYLLHLLHWRDVLGSVSFFAALFEGPFFLLGQSIAGIRMFSLGLLLACSGYCTWEVLRHVDRVLTPVSVPKSSAGYVAVGMAASLLYFGYLSTLRVPSYNLGALCSALLATGLLLRMLGTQAERPSTMAALAYGLSIGACGLSKPTAGVLLVALHLLYLVVAAWPWMRSHGLRVALLALVGIGIEVAYLFITDPDWARAVQEGLAMTGSTDGRSVFGLAQHVFWDTQRLVMRFAAWVVVIVGLFMAWLWRGRGTPFARSGWPPVLALAGAVVAMTWSTTVGVWLPAIVGSLAVLLAGAWLGRSTTTGWSRDDRSFLGLLLLLVALPPALSFGTNMPVFEHSQISSVFGVLALLAGVRRLEIEGILRPHHLTIALVLLCVPSLAIQVRAALQVEHTYRQLQPLAAQAESVEVGATGERIQVDAETARSLGAVKAAAAAAGWTAGQHMLDFTGDGPGWLYVLGARPVGVPWLLGGYPGSRDSAGYLLGKQSHLTLRGSWIVSSTNNPRRIEDWQSLLETQLGAGSHELVATVEVAAPYRWKRDAPARIDVQIWRPIQR